MVDREAIATALLARLATIPGVNTCSRRVRLWSDVPEGEQPALFLSETHAAAEQRRNLPPKWTLTYDLAVYVLDKSPEGPAAALNGLVAAIETALLPTPEEGPALPGYSTTLGGKVQHVWISSVEFDGGALGDQGVAVLQVDALAA